MMEKFFYLETLFTNPAERTVDSLSGLYSDKILIEKTVGRLISETIPADVINSRRILLKPNWVNHSKREVDKIVLRTDESIIIAVLKGILPFSPSKIVIGDSPSQGCIWEKMLSKEFIAIVNELSRMHSVAIEIQDFRMTVYDYDTGSQNTGLLSEEEYKIFDLGKDSYLEEITNGNRSKFRVTHYDPDVLSNNHRDGVHKYCIHRELFNSDVIINMPKVKTHQMTGLTGALKNFVGVNVNKDYLPHYRFGSTDRGGDRYPGNSYLQYLSEVFLDKANSRIGKSFYKTLTHLSALFWRISKRTNEHTYGGGWSGNDTAWRMVLDLNRIVEFGTVDGKITLEPQRRIYSIFDGIIAGEGNGPLLPDPLPLGILAITDSSAAGDYAMTILMQFKPTDIRLVANAYDDLPQKDFVWKINGETVEPVALNSISIPTQPPPGWIGKL